MSVKKKNSDKVETTKNKNPPKSAEPAPKKQKIGKNTSFSQDNSSSDLLNPAAKDIYLYDALSDDKAALQSIVNDWLSNYQEDQVDAIYQLLGVIVKVSGCSDVVSKESLRQEAHIVKVIEELQESIKDSSSEPPFLSKTKEGKKLKARVLEFFRLLVKLGLHDAFSEPTLLQFMKGWFLIMSSSAYRIFRQIATTLSLKFITYLCDACHDLEAEKNILLQQATGSKSRTKKAASKKNESKPQEISAHLTLLSHNIEEMFNGIFCHRFKDIDSSIRTEAISELGSWVIKYPDHFLNESHLKYFKWQLSDKNPSVRGESLNSLILIFERETFIPALRSLVSSIKTRLMELACKEVDLETKCLAIKLLFNIYSRGLLESSDCSELNPLLFHSEESVRNAIAPFIKFTIEEELLPEMAESELKVLIDAVSPSDRCKLSIKCFINLLSKREVLPSTFRFLDSNPMPLFESVEGPSVSTRELNSTKSPISMAVQALFSKFEPLQDWSTLLELASKDTPKGKKKQIVITEIEEPYLVEIIVSSFKILSDEQSNSKSTGKSIKQNSEPSNFFQLRNHLVQDVRPIRSLLKKHADNSQLVIQVLKIIENVLDGETFLESNNLKGFLELVTQIQKILINHHSIHVLYQVSQTIRTLGTFSSGVPQEFSSLMTSLSDELFDLFKQAKGNQHERVRILEKIRSLLFLVGSSFSSTFFSDQDFTSALWDGIDDGIYNQTLEEFEVSIVSIGILHLSWLWSCQTLNSDDSNINPDELSSIVLTRDKLLRVCLKILEIKYNSEIEGLSDLQRMAFNVANEVCWVSMSSSLFKDQKPFSLISSIEKACIQFVKGSLLHWEDLIHLQDPKQENKSKLSLSLKDLAARHCFNNIITVFIRSAIVGVFNLNSTIEILSRSGGLEPLMEESIKLFLNQGIKRRLKEASDSSSVRLIFGTLGESLTEGLKRCSTEEPLAKFEGVLNLTKTISAMLRSVGNNASRISQAVALFHQSTVWSAFQTLKLNSSNSSEEKNALQPFKFLSLLLKGIVAPMHSRELLRQVRDAAQEINADNDSVEWLPYFAYIKNLEEIQPATGVPPPDFVAPQNPPNA